MLYISRLIITVIYSILICVFGSIYCLFSPHNPEHVATFGYMFGRLAPLFGLKMECREPADAENYGNVVYITNRRNNYDMVATSSIVQPSTAMVGRKNLLWIPFFKQLYWSTGNLLIDRNNYTKTHGTITEVMDHFKKCHISIWMFPGGTHSRGHGLLPFETGAFRMATAVGVPIMPVRVSAASNKINLNQLRNGLVIVEVSPSTDVSQCDKGQVRELAAHCHSIMKQEIVEFDKEVAERGIAGKA